MKSDTFKVLYSGTVMSFKVFILLVASYMSDFFNFKFPKLHCSAKIQGFHKSFRLHVLHGVCF